jgi:hypothetical protein
VKLFKLLIFLILLNTIGCEFNIPSQKQTEDFVKKIYPNALVYVLPDSSYKFIIYGGKYLRYIRVSTDKLFISEGEDIGFSIRSDRIFGAIECK